MSGRELPNQFPGFTGEVDWSAAIPVFWGDARTELDECCYMGYFQNGPTCSDWLLHGLTIEIHQTYSGNIADKH